MKKPLKDVITKEELIKIYHDERLSMKDIADKFGYSKRAVMNLMNSYEIPRRERNKARFEKSATIQQKISRGDLIKKYIDEKKSTIEIAEEFNTTPGTISRIMSKYGIEARDKTEELLLRYSKNRGVDEVFFETDSPDLYYVLGLIASDGYITDGGTIGLTMNDKDVIYYAAKAMSYTNTITERISGESTSYSIRFTSPIVADILLSHGITPRKSLTMDAPTNIPRDYVSDFIRGVFDGDGTILETEQGSGRYKVGIVGGAEKFMAWIKQTIDEVLSHDVLMQIDRRGNGIYMYYFQTNERIAKFAEYIYGEDFDKFGMARKKERFLRSLINENIAI